MLGEAQMHANPLVSILRAVARFIVAVAVVAYTLLDELVFPLVRPLLRWLGELQLFQRLGTLIQRLPPYVVLALLAVPFVIIEPVKVVALYWIATGQVILGIVALGLAQIVSLLTCERIFHVGYEPLMRIGWFKALMGWLFGLRDRALAWVRATPAWRWAAGVAQGVRDWFRRLFA
jgi:hypothetical protein